MMMAPDSTPHRPQLESTSLDALASALTTYLATGDDGAALQSALRAIAEEARRKAMHAEDLLIALKDVWFGLAPVRSVAESEEQSRMLQRVVTLCIREYYSV